MYNKSKRPSGRLPVMPVLMRLTRRNNEMNKQSNTEKFLIAIAILYPGVGFWVEDGELVTNYQGDDKQALLGAMAITIMEHCRS